MSQTIIKALGLIAATILATMAFAQGGQGDDPHAADRPATGAMPVIGDHLDAAQLHRVSRPGLYGISQPPQGSAYGVIEGRLIRYDVDTMHIQSIIREVDGIRD